MIANNFPNVHPTLNLNFAASGHLDPFVTITRSSSGRFFDRRGHLVTVGSNIPRIEFDPVTGECLGLLLEEAGQNYAVNPTASGGVAPSTMPTDWVWFRSGSSTATITFESAGVTNGLNYARFRVQGVADGGSVVVRPAMTAASPGDTWTGSVFIRRGGGSMTGIASISTETTLRNAAGTILATTSVTHNVTTAPLKNLRTKHTVTSTNSGITAAHIGVRINIKNTGETIDYTIDIGFPQLEKGTARTSPTVGVRAADSLVFDTTKTSSFWNSSEGSIVVGYRTGESLVTGMEAFNAVGTTGNHIKVIARDASANTGGYMQVYNGGANQATIPAAGTVTIDQHTTVAGAYKNNDFAASRNGQAVATDNNGTVPTITTVRLTPLTGHIKWVYVYDTRITNEQLRALSATPVPVPVMIWGNNAGYFGPLQ